MYLFAPCVGRDIAFAASFVGEETSVLRLNDVGANLANARLALSSIGWQLGKEMKVSSAVTRFEALTPLSKVLAVEIDSNDAKDFVLEAELGSIKTFVYHHDGSSEGGSGLGFLGPGMGRQKNSLVDQLMEKLADHAFVVTDGSNGDFRFRKLKVFSKYGRTWTPIRQIVARDSSYRATWLWTATRTLP